MTILVAVVVAALGCFALRRVVLLCAAMLPARGVAPLGDDLPDVTLIVPACNEAAGIDATLEALARLDYPAERLVLVLVDDCSDDRTAAHLERWATPRARTSVVRLPQRMGKPRAVEAGVAVAPRSELIAICDADVRLRPDNLRRVVAAFRDDTVGGAVGYLAPANALAGPVATYAAVESWMHQLVTSAGKDRLDLNPPTLGGAPVFRRDALEAIGWLGPAATGDDVRATVALTRAGWRTRFVVDAVAENDVADDVHAYWRQHLRWARDLHASARWQRRPVAGVPIARRVEAAMLSVGYLDRVVLLAAFGLVAGGACPVWVPAGYLAVVAAEVVWAIVRAGAGRRLGLVLLRTAMVFPLDVTGSVVASLLDLVSGPGRRPPLRGGGEERDAP